MQKKTTIIFVFLLFHFVVGVGVFTKKKKQKKSHDSSGTLKYIFYFISSRGEKLGTYKKYECWKTKQAFSPLLFSSNEVSLFAVYW